MSRSVILVAALSAGCSIENSFGDGLPSWPDSNVPPVSDITRTDVIVQVTTPQVDILWMIDNSCSMSNEQTDLTENFPYFMDYFVGSGLDYHVGITSSDQGNNSSYPGAEGTLVTLGSLKYLDQDTPSPVSTFSAMAGLGTTGRFPERGLGGTYLALEVKRDTINAGFYRDEAALHTIIISDEADYTLDSLVTLPEYIDWYDGIKPEAGDRSFSAIIAGNRGQRYADVYRAIGGVIWDLQEDNWPALLDQLGLQASGFKREYFLSALPVPGSVTVEVEIPSGAIQKFDEGEEWEYDEIRNSITFLEFVPEELSKVRISYTLLAATQGDPSEPSP